MSEFLKLFAKDGKGYNSVWMVTSIDVGFDEYWTANIAWFEGDEAINFFTQYNPPHFCREENCLHFPRNHLDDATMDYKGNIVFNGADII